MPNAILANFAAGIAAMALAALPASAKTLRTNVFGDPNSLDPIKCAELGCEFILRNVYEGLTRFDRDGRLEPALATKWTAHPDRLGWTFRLRPGVKFHSGNILTARDVKFSLEQILLPANKAGPIAGYLERIVGARELRSGTATELTGVQAYRAASGGGKTRGD